MGDAVGAAVVGAAVADAVGGGVGTDGGDNCGPGAAGCAVAGGGPAVAGEALAAGGPTQTDPSPVTVFVNPCAMHLTLGEHCSVAVPQEYTACKCTSYAAQSLQLTV